MSFLPFQIFAQEHALAYYVNAALTNSPLLKDYASRQQSNAIDSARIKAEYGPQVGFSSVNMYAPVVNGWGYDNAITNGAQVSAQVGVSKQFAGAKNTGNQYDYLRTQNQSLAVQGKISEQDLRKNVTAQYINAYGDLQEYKSGNDLLVQLQKEELILRQLTQSGIYRQVDYLAFLGVVQQQQLQVQQFLLRYRYDLGELNYSCGITDTSYTEIGDPALQLSAPPDVHNSVFYKQYVIDSTLNVINSRSIDFSYHPHFGLFGDAGYLSSLAATPYKNFGLSAGFYLAVPIYDGGQKKLLHNKNTIELNTNMAYKNYFVAQYNQQLALLFQQMEANEKLASLYTDELKNAEALVAADRALLSTGDVHITDYILALNNYLAVKNNYVQYTVNRYTIINEINYWNRTN